MISASHLALLKSVSRSFYLSIRFLPREMREPVALGYLLARLTDTLADAPGLGKEDRLDRLEIMRRAIQGEKGVSVEDIVKTSSQIEKEGERNLLQQTNELMEWYVNMDPANRSHLSEVILTIIHGQEWDTTFFEKGKINACANRDELLRYTYWVAGCVGEFWTKVGFTSLGEGFAAPEEASKMLVRGRKLGQGLQLINILRDLHEDLPAGRVYLPQDELVAAGWDAESIPRPDHIEPVFVRWIDQCEEFLALSGPYTEVIQNGRVRFSTRLPMDLAAKTARLLRKAECERVMQQRFKIPRSEVWKSMAKTLFR